MSFDRTKKGKLSRWVPSLSSYHISPIQELMLNPCEKRMHCKFITKLVLYKCCGANFTQNLNDQTKVFIFYCSFHLRRTFNVCRVLSYDWHSLTLVNSFSAWNGERIDSCWERSWLSHFAASVREDRRVYSFIVNSLVQKLMLWRF